VAKKENLFLRFISPYMALQNQNSKIKNVRYCKQLAFLLSCAVVIMFNLLKLPYCISVKGRSRLS